MCFVKSQVITETLKNFDGKNLKPLMKGPSQVVILAVQVYCTAQIDAVFTSSNVKLSDVSEKFDDFFGRLQKELKASNNRVHQMTAEAVTLAHIYYRDLLSELSSDEQSVLLWESTFKFRWLDGRIQIQVMDMSLDYGMEYIGQPTKMMTFTDVKRTGLTIANALSYHLAGILVGMPRTELLASLSHCLGQRLIRFDCSELVGAQDVLRQIRGATTCGIWLCYNRVEELDHRTTSFMSALLIQLQNIASTTPPWLESTETTLPQYGVFCLTGQESQQRPLFDPTLRRTASLRLPDLESFAQVILLLLYSIYSQWTLMVCFQSGLVSDSLESCAGIP